MTHFTNATAFSPADTFLTARAKRWLAMLAAAIRRASALVSNAQQIKITVI
jgi:hypothetical protein